MADIVIRDVNREEISQISNLFKNKELNLEININFTVENMINMVEYYISSKMEHIGDIRDYEEYSPEICNTGDTVAINLFCDKPDEHILMELYEEFGLDFEYDVNLEHFMSVLFMNYTSRELNKDDNTISLYIPIENYVHDIFYNYFNEI